MKTLPAIPDRKITYYKMMNLYERHNGLQYHDGLIIDPVKFNDSSEASCVPGGIYFTTKKYLYRFFGWGEIIRPITIPSDAKVVLDPIGDKYRADRLFFHPKKDMDFYFDNLFDKTTFPEKGYWQLVTYCSKYFDKWFDKETFSKERYWSLAMYCSDHFDKWFDKETFPKEHYWSLINHCSDHFNDWFDKEIFPKEHYRYLAQSCSDNFDKWFDKKAFPTNDYWYLTKYCKKYEHIWGK